LFFTGDATRPGVSHDPETAERPGATDDHDTAEPRDCRRPPVGLETDATRLDGVVLVTCRLHNRTTTARAVRLRDELPGETLPPRRDGVPERGWDGDTYTTVVPPETTHPVGYASPADGDLPDAPATLVTVDDPATFADGDRVDHARRELADWAPPAEVLPQRLVPDGGSPDGVAADGDTRAGDSDGVDSEAFADGTVPTVVAAYLEAAAERIDRAAATAEGVQAATDALRDTHHTPVTLEQAVARDEAALRALAEWAATLADRAAAASVPVDSLRRLS
jgi:hypothetical protein